MESRCDILDEMESVESDHALSLKYNWRYFFAIYYLSLYSDGFSYTFHMIFTRLENIGKFSDFPYMTHDIRYWPYSV